MITEDLDVFLSDFGVSITAGAVSGVGILDMPGESVMGDMVISTGYRVICRADSFGWLSYGGLINADGQAYRVQELKLISDGRFCSIELEKTTDAGPVEFVFDGDFE